jgi:methyl-accepting chemotaxis protein
MKKTRLALRVTMNSIGMIFAIYFVMQIVAYFRDNAILGISSLRALPASVAFFLAMYVLPPMVICGGLLYLFARPLEKTLGRLRAGETLSPEVAERTRVRILGFHVILYALNIVGFVLGFVILVLIEDGVAGLATPYRILILVSNVAGACVYAASQSALSNIAFGELRDRLNLREIGTRRREIRRWVQQILIGTALVVYALTFLEFNQQIHTRYCELGSSALVAERQGTLTRDEAIKAFHDGIPSIMPNALLRGDVNLDEIPLPCETVTTAEHREMTIFLLHAFFIVLVAILIHTTTALEVRDQMNAMRARIADVLDGEGDLRKRLTLRSMDEYGEQAELINRLLSRFHDMAVRITTAAAETRAVAQSIDHVLHDAERTSKDAGEAVATLADSIETEAESSRELTKALDSFREAARAVGLAIEEQRRFADDTAAAMEEMSANIRSVEAMTDRSGSLTGDLAFKGAEGSGAVTEASAAIREIENASQDVLKVLQSLTKIAGDTNLLAMNAAIEAAHAGESGAGFAVVADEVRRLATDAARATKSIKDLMSTMNARVQRGVEASNVSGTSFSRLADGISQAASISKEIAQAMREQGQGTKEVEQAIARVVGATDTIRSRMGEQDERTRAMEQSLASALDRLSDLAFASHEQSAAVHRLDESFAAVRAEVDRNISATGALENVLSGLKV